MPQSVGSPKFSLGRTVLAAGLLLGSTAVSTASIAQDAATPEPSVTNELLLPKAENDEAAAKHGETATEVLTKTGQTPSFEELDSAASDLNEALSGARAKLDELRQATELAAMAAELREELENSLQENNRLAASLAEVQSERSDLQAQSNEAQRKISELTETVERSETEIEQQSDQLQLRQERIEEVDAARGMAEEQARVLEAELADAGTELGKLRDEIAELSGQLESTRTELGEANDRADAALEARDSADSELSKVRKQIAGMLRSVLLGGEPIDVSKFEENGTEINGQAGVGLGVRYEAIRASNVRAAPDPDAERVGFAKRGDPVTVFNKVAGKNWFEIETIDGIRGYIFGDLIEPRA